MQVLVFFAYFQSIVAHYGMHLPIEVHLISVVLKVLFSILKVPILLHELWSVVHRFAQLFTSQHKPLFAHLIPFLHYLWHEFFYFLFDPFGCWLNFRSGGLGIELDEANWG